VSGQSETADADAAHRTGADEGAEAERTKGLIDPVSLGRWMDDQGLAGRGEPVTSRFISGGASNEIFEICRGEHRWALRRPPRDVPEGRNEIMMREYRIISALADTDVPHARAAGGTDDTSVLGSAFYLMDFVDGWSPISESGWPEPFASDMDARPGLAFELVDAIAKLSRVDWKANGLEGLGRPDGFHERQVDRWYAHLSRFKFRDIPGLEEAGDWLRGRTPRSYVPGIMHGDYQFANVMYHHGAPARLAAIVDWEMGTVGDPLLDLAWVVMNWPDHEADRPSMGYIDYEGLPFTGDLLERYAAMSGRDVDEMDYYVILARFKLAIVLEGGYARFVSGEADNPRLEGFGQIVLDLARDAAALAQTTKL